MSNKIVNENLEYFESQRLSKFWLTVFAIVIFASIALIIFDVYQRTPPVDPSWTYYLGTIAIISFILICFIGLVSLKLFVSVDEDGILIRYRPFLTRLIKFEDIESAKARKYKVIREYGGWGIKGYSKNKITYNARGDMGVEITLKDKRMIMIGSQTPDQLEEVILKHLKNPH